jgi:tetratricopeptide (TPR) repeat protein
LTDAWRSACSGRGRAVEVVGDAGMGKSRLLSELCAAVAVDGGHAITVVRPDHYRASVPYATSASLLRSAASIGADLSPPEAGAALDPRTRSVAPHLLPWLPLIADAAEAIVPSTEAVDRLDQEWVPSRRNGAVLELLEAARPGPWLLVVDDLLSVDDASRELLAAVAAVAPSRSWLVCMSRRNDEAGLDGVSTDLIELGPLTADAATRLVLAAAPAPVADVVLSRLLAAAGGNALFLENLAAHALGDDDELPQTVERVLAARIDTLRPADRQLLRDLSVVGRSSPVTVVAALLAEPELSRRRRWEPLASFVEVEDGVVRFRSDLMRTVAYQGLPFRRRRELHLAMARMLSQSAGEHDRLDDDTVGVLAAHLLEAGDAAAAWPVAIDAARRAVARVALADAADVYRRALRIAPQVAGLSDGELAAVHEEHGDVCHSLGRFERALAAYASAARLRSDAIGLARLCSRRAAVEQKRGELRRALAWGTRGLRLVENARGEEARTVRAQLALDQAATRHYQGRHRESVVWSERALADAARTSDDRLLGAVYLHLEMAHSPLGDGLASAYGSKATELFAQAGDRKGLGDALVNGGLTAYNEGRWNDARDLYERAAEVISTTGNVTQAAVVMTNTAFLLAELGEVEPAAALAVDAERAFRAGGHEMFVGYIDLLSSRLALWERDYERADELVSSARARFAAHGNPHMVLDCDVVRVERLLHAGHNDDAANEAARLVAVIDSFGPAEHLPVTIRRLLSRALVRTVRAVEANDAAAAALSRARDFGARFEIALCLDALAQAQLAMGNPAPPNVVAERDEILNGLGVKRTLFPLAH